MGAMGRKGEKSRFNVGSVARKIVAGSPVPVVITPELLTQIDLKQAFGPPGFKGSPSLAEFWDAMGKNSKTKLPIATSDIRVH